MRAIYNYIYNMDYFWLCVWSVLILGGWTALMTVLSERKRRWICLSAVVLAVFLIVGKTLLGRTVEQNLYFPQWNPLHSVILYWDQPQQWRAMCMNVLLFAPLGGCLPYLSGGSPARRVWTAVGIGCALSFAIECVQQLTCIGCLQTEDWLLNTLGTLVGAAAYFVHSTLAKRRGK